jgi:hypothetical protein
MKRERIINLAWPLVVLLAVLLLGGGAWGVGAILFEDPATRKSYPNKTVAGYLGAASGGLVEVQTMAQPTQGQVLIAGCGTDTATGTATVTCARFGASASGLPSGTPGQVPTIRADTSTGIVTATATQTATGTATSAVYTHTATGTVTGTGTHYVAEYTPPDIRGTYFLRWVEIGEYGNFPAWQRWGSLAWRDAVSFPANHALSGTCSSGVQALIGHFKFDSNVNGNKDDGRPLIPAGDWVFKLRAKVNANAATLRVMVMDHYGTPIASDHLILDVSTDSFSNTSYQTITKRVSMPEIWREQFTNTNSLEFLVYANCEPSTTVSIELNDPSISSRIETPLTFDEIQQSDVNGLVASLDGLNTSINSLYDGKSGLPYNAAAGDVLCKSSNTNPYYIIEACSPQPEPKISGVPGQFVKFAGTGTSTTTSKEAGLPGLTTRKFTVKASDFAYGSGAASGNISTQMHVWTLRDGQQDYIYSTVLELPADYVSGLTVSMIWMPSATDNTSTNTVRWKIIAQALTAGASPPYNNRVDTWNGSQCGTGCQEGSVVKETAKALTAFSSGTPYSISVMRDGHSAGDTYVGDVKWIGMEFSYTSSF